MQDKKSHGIGFVNIKCTTEKYQGTMDFKEKGRAFILSMKMKNERRSEDVKKELYKYGGIWGNSNANTDGYYDKIHSYVKTWKTSDHSPVTWTLSQRHLELSHTVKSPGKANVPGGMLGSRFRLVCWMRFLQMRVLRQWYWKNQERQKGRIWKSDKVALLTLSFAEAFIFLTLQAAWLIFKC